MMQVYPNPNEGEFIVRFNLAKRNYVQISIYTIEEQLIINENLSDLSIGWNEHKIQLSNLKESGSFMVTLQSDVKKAVQKLIIN